VSSGAAEIHDPNRLAALAVTGLMDSPFEESFDRLTRLAAQFIGTPLALVNLVDDRRQFAKSCVAPSTWPADREAPLADSFCKWAVISGEPVVIEDARRDERVSGSAMVPLGLISYAGIPLVTSQGYVLGSLCVADFAPRRWTPGELQVLRDLAGAVVTEIELRADIAARLEAERAKDEFVSVVSHELRTPLTSIRGSLGLLASGQLAGERAQRMLDVAIQNTDRLVRLINNILDVERVESGKVQLEVRRVAARELIEQAVEATQGLATRAGVPVEWTAPPELHVHADPDRVVQVITNLLSNAIKFSPAGSPVRVSAEARGAEALFQVRDRGRGIPPEHLDDIFERFQQVDSSDSREKGGSGLGLAISRSLVQQHAGQIWVSSELGRGSTFFFTLPTDTSDPTAARNGTR